MTYTSLYRFYDDQGVLLYVGVTNSLSHRLAQHEASKSWWRAVRSVTVEHHDSREEVERAEREAIRTELPFWNIAHQPTVPMIERLVSLRPALGAVVDEVHDQRRRAAVDPDWCFYEAWYSAGIRQRAKFALVGADLPMESSVGVRTVDDFVGAGPRAAFHAHEDWLESSWAFVAETLARLLPSCGRGCEHHEQEHDEEPF